MPNEDSRSMKRRGWRHAFAVDKPEAEPTDVQREVVEKLAREIVRRRLTTPAIAFLEMSRPLNFLASQAMHFFHPIVSVITNAEGYRAFAEFLEQRGSVEFICVRIETLEAEATAREKGQGERSENGEQRAESEARGEKSECEDESPGDAPC